MIKGFDEIEAEIASHPGKIAHDEWTNLGRIFYDIHQKNKRLLVRYLEEPSKNDKLSIELFQNVRPPSVKEVYTNELLRHLYNYLSSLSALIDSSSRLTKKYGDNKHFLDFHKKSDVIKTSKNSAFLGNLRNYIQHYGIPPLGWQIRLREDTHNECTYFLSKKKLLEWDKWNSKAKEFIESGKENINLLETINAHAKAIDELYETLLKLFPVLHGKDIDALNALGRRRNDILSGKIRL